MTLTELKYVVAVAGELHFGHAAKKCFVSQPTLSVAIKKLEDELGITIFERHKHDVTITPLGKKIVAQAQMVIDQANTIKLIANEALEPFKTNLQLGIIYTIGPYLLPKLIPLIHHSAPELTLIIDEDFTVNLTEKLKRGELDMLIVSTPFNAKGIITELLYKEPLVVALPRGHSLCRKKTIKADDLLSETLLLLKTGNCFRDQVMDVCPACKGEVFSKAKIQQTLEGSSLETIRQMVATGSGVTILPGSSIFDPIEKNSLVEYRPFSRPVPKREVILAYRDTYPGKKLISLISETISNCGLNDL